MKKPGLIAIVLGVITALLVALYLNSLETTYRAGSQKVPVLVAKQYIDQGSMLDDALVEIKQVPKDYVQPRAVNAVKDLYDSEGRRTFMVTTPIEKDEQVIVTKLTMLGLDTGVSAIIPTDKRAMTLTFDGDTVNGKIKPGNRVDIIGVFTYEDTSNRPQEAAVTVLQNLFVLSVGNSILGMQNRVKKGSLNEMADAGSGSAAVTFALTPKEAEMLTLCSEKGTLKLSLRPIGDDKYVETPGSRLREIVKDAMSSVPKSAVANSPAAAMSASYMKEMQEKQKDVLELLRKYKK
jgi:pilus assembly protein CpaB